MSFHHFLQIPLLYLLLSFFIVKTCEAQTSTTTLTPAATGSWTQSGAGVAWSIDSGPCWSVSLSQAQPYSQILNFSSFNWTIPSSYEVTQIDMTVTYKNDGSSVSDFLVNLYNNYNLTTPRFWEAGNTQHSYTYTVPNYGWTGSVLTQDDFMLSYQVRFNGTISAVATVCSWNLKATFVPPSPSTSPSRTPTPSITPSISVTPSTTPSPSVTPTPTPSVTPTPSPSSSPSASPSVTPTPSPSTLHDNTSTVTPYPSVSQTPSPSVSQSPSSAPTPSVSPSLSPTAAASIIPTGSPTSLAVTPSSVPTSSGSGSSSNSKSAVIGVAVGASAGGLCLVGILVALLFMRRKKKQGGESAVELQFNAMPPPPQPTSKPVSFYDDSGIHLTDVKILHLLGKGKFGEVYQGLWSDTTAVACKKLKQGERTEFENEIKLISKLNHPNIVRCLGIYVPDSDTTYMVLELLKLGSLADFLRNTHIQKKLSVENLIELCLNTAAGMSYLESKNIVHRDLGARNLLVTETDSKYIVKVSDFGLSRQVESEVYNASENVFPVRWSPPEVINYRKFSTKSDVWSFAITCWEIFEYGKLPYPGLSNQEVIEQVIGGYRLPQPETCPASVYKLLLECWKEDPNSRPDFKTIYTTIKNILADMKGQQENDSVQNLRTQQGHDHYNTEGTYQTQNANDGYNT